MILSYIDFNVSQVLSKGRYHMNTLMECLKKGTSPVQVVNYAKEYLNSRGFTERSLSEPGTISSGDRFYISPFPDVIFPCAVGAQADSDAIVTMAYAHVDQPCFKLKAKPEFGSMHTRQINVELYGGMTMHTWIDRPLGMSGMVMLKGKDAFSPVPRLYDSHRPLAVIPGLAIHMDRNRNEGWKIDPQRELMPVAGLDGSAWTEGTFAAFLASELQVEPEEILSYDLNLYNMDAPVLAGLQEELLISPRIDNLASVAAILEAVTQEHSGNSIIIAGLFNHEEVGSFTKSGADSELPKLVVEQVLRACGITNVLKTLEKSYYLSVDGAHGAHPNYPDKCDPTTRAYVGKGVTIKSNGTFKYASDCRMQAIMESLAKEENIPLQIINDRNNIRGGTTLGPMIASHLPMMGCDIGLPMWAMHSANETMAAKDYDSLVNLLKKFFDYH